VEVGKSETVGLGGSTILFQLALLAGQGHQGQTLLSLAGIGHTMMSEWCARSIIVFLTPDPRPPTPDPRRQFPHAQPLRSKTPSRAAFFRACRPLPNMVGGGIEYGSQGPSRGARQSSAWPSPTLNTIGMSHHGPASALHADEQSGPTGPASGPLRRGRYGAVACAKPGLAAL